MDGSNGPSKIWVHVPFERVDKKTGKAKTTLEITIEKKSMVNLVQAYSVSVKVSRSDFERTK